MPITQIEQIGANEDSCLEW